MAALHCVVHAPLVLCLHVSLVAPQTEARRVVGRMAVCDDAGVVHNLGVGEGCEHHNIMIGEEVQNDGLLCVIGSTARFPML